MFYLPGTYWDLLAIVSVGGKKSLYRHGQCHVDTADVDIRLHIFVCNVPTSTIPGINITPKVPLRES